MEESWVVTWFDDRGWDAESKIERLDAPEIYVEGYVAALIRAGKLSVIKARVQ